MGRREKAKGRVARPSPLVAVAALLVVLALSPAHAGTRTEFASYIGGSNTGSPLCALLGPTETSLDHVAGACFKLQGNETDVFLFARDDSYFHVGLSWHFKAGSLSTSGLLCDGGDLAVPPGATELTVMVGDQGGTVIQLCEGGATTGTIRATFTTSP